MPHPKRARRIQINSGVPHDGTSGRVAPQNPKIRAMIMRSQKRNPILILSSNESVASVARTAGASPFKSRSGSPWPSTSLDRQAGKG